MWIYIISTLGLGGLVIVPYVFNNSYMFNLDRSYLYINHNFVPYYCQHVVKNFRGCVRAVLRILKRQRVFRVVGMDCEMTSTSVNGGHPVPALLQLANPDGYCAIFQLKVMERANDYVKVPYLTEFPKMSQFKLPSENIMRQILEDPNLLKVGVAVIDDARYLEESYGLFCKGCLDIRHLAKHAGFEPRGLDYLAKHVLGKEKVELRKKSRQPWESLDLNNDQISYASQDARLGVGIFLKLNQILMERSYSWWRRLFWNEKTYWKYSLKFWKVYIGKPFEFSSREDWDDSFFPRRTWKDLVSYIPLKNASLELSQSLFRFESRNLHYTPESTAFGTVCYRCGFPDDGSLNVKLKPFVPLDYHVDFEDKTLYYIYLCQDCLEECRTRVDYNLRHELTEKFGAPYPDYEDHRLITAKKLASELLSSNNEEEKEWTTILESSLHKLIPDLPRKGFHDRTMEIILSMDCWPDTDHGRFIHDYFEQYGGGLEELRWLWCKRFWRVMRPDYLPQAWIDFYRSDPRWLWILS